MKLALAFAALVACQSAPPHVAAPPPHSIQPTHDAPADAGLANRSEASPSEGEVGATFRGSVPEDAALGTGGGGMGGPIDVQHIWP